MDGMPQASPFVSYSLVLRRPHTLLVAMGDDGIKVSLNYLVDDASFYVVVAPLDVPSFPRKVIDPLENGGGAELSSYLELHQCLKQPWLDHANGPVGLDSLPLPLERHLVSRCRS